MKTIKEFTEQTNIDPELVRAVIRQAGHWGHFKDSAPDIANHGIDGGFHGFIYYTDTVSFAAKYSSKIIKMASDMAEELGEPSGFGLIAGFNCLKDLNLSPDDVYRAIYCMGHQAEDNTEVLNALAWFAGEEVARAYTDALEAA